MSDILHKRPTLLEALGIQFREETLGTEQVEATMPVDERTIQPYGMLHGGASVALAESVASYGAYTLVEKLGKVPVGLEINANHIKSMRSGFVKAIGTVEHFGETTMVWTIRIVDEADETRLICLSRCTIALLQQAVQGK
ncbi:hotdog fold thioesterase [Bacillus fonticola]|uniref:hotdog fold thioesterase n=1 Tax=Bacillus fonticola TaxID=2728853 RepID=UPI0014738D64|nr:hotdog fold thioesterase [Bacillus fonticola]